MRNLNESVALYELSYLDENKHFAYLLRLGARFLTWGFCELVETVGSAFEYLRPVF